MAYGNHFGQLQGHSGVTLRWHWNTLGWLWHHFGVTLGSCCGHCGHLELLLGHIGEFLGHFATPLGLTLGAFGGNVGT